MSSANEIEITNITDKVTKNDTTVNTSPSETVIVTTTTVTTESSNNSPPPIVATTKEQAVDTTDCSIKKMTETTLTTSSPIIVNGENGNSMQKSQQQQMQPNQDHQPTDKMDHHDLINFKVLYVLAQLCGATLIVMMATWVGVYMGGVSWRENPKQEFFWHPVLMTIGMIYFYGNGILVYRGLRNCRKKSLKLIHAGIQMFAFVCVVIALVAVFDSHNLNNPPIANMYTLHSWLGLAAVILFSLQYVFGFAMFLVPGRKESLKAAFMPIHIFFGLLGFILAIAAALMGLTEKAIWAIPTYELLPSSAVMVNIMGVLYIVFGSLVVYLTTEASYKRQPIPEDTQLLTGANE